jgi:hypothetical protein
MRVMIACLLAAITLTAQAPKPQDPPSDCAADGSVVNGLTGQPLRRANVSTGYSSPSGTSTDADGKWTISGIACGGIIFTAEKDGFIQNSYGRPAAKAQVNTALKPVTLTSGNVVHGLKIELMPESVATGRVLDDAGDPVSGAQVRAMRSFLREGKRMMLPSGYASSDSSGTYRMSGLAAGRYFLCATSSRVRYPIGGGNAVIYGENCFPGPVPANAQGGMQIGSGQEEHADFTLTEATGVHIRGAVSGGVPAPVTIQLFKIDANGFNGGTTLRPQQTRKRQV